MHPKRFVSNFWGAVQALPKGREFHWRPLPSPPQGAGSSTGGPSPSLPKGREFLPAVFEVVVWRSFPLGKVRMGLVWHSFPLGKAGMGLWMGLVFLLLPLWRVGAKP